MFKQIIAIGLFALVGCQQNSPTTDDPATQKRPGFGLLNRQSNMAVIIDSAGRPVPNASILIGKKVGAPFENNFVTSDYFGHFVVPADWKSPQDLTIDAPGYIRATYVNVTRDRTTYQLANAPGREKLEISGNTINWEQLKKDGFIDFGLIMPMADKRGLLEFNIPNLLSPEVDKISAYGRDIFIPSNFSIPKQSENYILPVTVEKLRYRSYVRKPSKYSYYAAKAKFPFKDVIKELENGKTYFDVLNKIEFLGGAVADVDVVSQKTNLDLDVQSLKFQPLATVRSNAIATGFSQLISVWNEKGGLYFASDAKIFNSNESRQMKAARGNRHILLSIIGAQQKLKSQMVTLKEQMSRAMVELPSSGEARPSHLDLIAEPKFNGSSVTATPPSASNFQPIGTHIALSDVDITDTEESYYESKTTLWEVYAEEWVANYDLPEWPGPLGQSLIKRLEVAYLAVENTASKDPVDIEANPEMITTVTHVTKNAVDF